MTTKLETSQQYGKHADTAVGYMVEINELDAQQTAALDAVKAHYSPQLDSLKKKLKSLKARLTNYAKHEVKSLRIFGGKETGTFTTNRAKVTVKKNPSSIKLENKDADMDQLIIDAKKMGFGNVIIPSEKFSIEAMEKLTDAELKRLGWKRVSENKTFTLEPTEDAAIKEKETLEPTVA